MMKHTALAAMALLCAGTAMAHAQISGCARGYVVDEKGKPLAFATVRIEGTTRGAYTNADGSFLIRGIPAGDYRVKVTAVGYHAATREKVRITIGDTTTVALFTLTAMTGEEIGRVSIPVNGQHATVLQSSRVTLESLIRADSLGRLLEPARWRERPIETSIRVDGVDTAVTDSAALRRKP